jgi:ribonuclease-3
LIAQLLSGLYHSSFSAHKQLYRQIRSIAGFSPRKLSYYIQSLTHHSVASTIHESGARDSNERLEYLGDSVLNSIIAELLFNKFPFKDEGFLTEMRSKIVSRESLNDLAIKIGLNNIVEFDKRSMALNNKNSIYGNALEAFIGAIFLDAGFAGARKFVRHRLLTHLDLDKLQHTESNFKGRLIEWSQKHGKSIDFESTEEVTRRQKIFRVRIMIDGKLLAESEHLSKKKAEQLAAQKVCIALNVL